MIRSIIPLIAVLLFFLEPVFSLFSPLEIGGVFYTLVPRFVIVFLIFIAVYYNKKQAIIYGIVLGLLYDMFYIDIIGLYAFLFPMICFIAAMIVRQVYRHIVTIMVLCIFLVALLEVLSYVFASLVALTTIGFGDFIFGRLVPTMIANSLFVVMFGWVFKTLINKQALKSMRETL